VHDQSKPRRPLIWIVDDSPTEAAIAERSLGNGFRFERFVDGSMVLERLSTSDHQPDLLLLDWVMPGMAGDEVCRFLRTRTQTRELPIIMVTANRIETADVVEGLANGANDYLARPFAPEELRARVEAALRSKQLTDLATRTAKFQEEMLGIVGHDLRNPLAAVLAGAEVLEQLAEDAPALTPTILRIKASAHRMMSIVDQLLDVTRARLGSGIPITPRPTSLVAIVTAVLEELTLAYPKTRFELRPGPGADGVWDPDRLAQVISNLMANGAQYGRPGTPVVVEILGVSGNAVVTVHNTVRDAAIPPHVVAALFEPYQRGKTEGHATGLGLGLYIVNEIVRAHGGAVEVESTVAAGTVFRVVLPTHAISGR
jgi:signal transduction histidine kinase